MNSDAKRKVFGAEPWVLSARGIPFYPRNDWDPLLLSFQETLAMTCRNSQFADCGVVGLTDSNRRSDVILRCISEARQKLQRTPTGSQHAPTRRIHSFVA